MNRGILPVVHRRNKVITIHTLPFISHLRSLTGSLVYLHGNKISTDIRHRPRGKSTRNDNYCYASVAGKKNSVYVTGKLNRFDVKMTGEEDCLFVTSKRKTVIFLPVNSGVVTRVTFEGGLPHKKGVNPGIVHSQEI